MTIDELDISAMVKLFQKRNEGNEILERMLGVGKVVQHKGVVQLKMVAVTRHWQYGAEKFLTKEKIALRHIWMKKI